MIKNESDIRVIKTRRAIKAAFAALIEEKDLEKITVSELANRAEINKGTFYLHYKDIYDLHYSYMSDIIEDFLDGITFYDLFFENPKAFLAKLMIYYKKRQDEYPGLALNSRGNQAPILFADIMRKELYKTKRIEKNELNDTAIEFIVFATIGIMIRHTPAEANIAAIGDVASKVIAALFKEKE